MLDQQIEASTDPNQVNVLEAEKTKHLQEATFQQSKLSGFEESGPTEPEGNEWRTIATDLQQTLPCPKLNNQSAYYRTKLWVYNQAVSDLQTKTQNYYMWLETESEKGSDEVASCLFDWVLTHILEGFRKLRVFMDNCAGKLLDIIIIVFLYFLLLKLFLIQF